MTISVVISLISLIVTSIFSMIIVILKLIEMYGQHKNN